MCVCVCCEIDTDLKGKILRDRRGKERNVGNAVYKSLEDIYICYKTLTDLNVESC